MSPDGKVVLVTGAGSGIGRAVALRLQADGDTVVLAGRRIEALEETVQAGERSGGPMLACPADVSDPAEVGVLFAAISENFGRLDVLFNNAGIMTPATPFEDLTLRQWQEAVDVNLTGSFLCARQAFTMMKDQTPQGGRIINNGSISAYAPRPFSAPYTATKHAIAGLTKSISLDGRRYNIACGQIDIGNAATEMTRPMGDGFVQADGSVVAEPRMDVRHVADAVHYMANLPLDANVQFMTVLATAMPYIGRG